MAKKEIKQDKTLEQVLADIEKQFGKGSIMRLGENTNMEVEVTSSGSLALDLALGVNGFPKGRIIEIFGPESSGKTTVALHAIAEVQKTGGRAAFIDAEHALDPVYAKRLGVNIDELLISQPDTGEQALEICEALVRSEAVDIVVIDSVAALVPKAEIEGEMGDSHVGLQARLMSQALRKLSGTVNKTKTTCIFINQLREMVGNKTVIKVVKNKVAPPFKTAVVEIMYGLGISKESEIIDLAVEAGIIDKSGAWYSYNQSKIGQGKENVKSLLRENKKLCEEIEKKVREVYVKKPDKSDKNDK